MADLKEKSLILLVILGSLSHPSFSSAVPTHPWTRRENMGIVTQDILTCFGSQHQVIESKIQWCLRDGVT